MVQDRPVEDHEGHPFDRLISWMHRRPDYIRSEFHDDCGGATFSVADEGFCAASGAAMSQAGFEVDFTSSGWTATEPVWNGIPRTGRWEISRCTPATNGSSHDTFEIVYERETIVNHER